jgi:nucleoside-triphosphatase
MEINLHVLGVGKTTLVKKVCDQLEDEKWECQGFYTEERREDGQRVGFDVVTFDGKRGTLARVVDRLVFTLGLKVCL